MKQFSPNIVPLAQRLLAEITRSVAVFPVKYQRTLGNDLRADALQIVLKSQEAARLQSKPGPQVAMLDQLSEAIDRVKAQWQTGFTLECFSFKRSGEVGRILNSVGKQCGGWKEAAELRHKGQNPVVQGQPERASILSTGIASHAGATR